MKRLFMVAVVTVFALGPVTACKKKEEPKPETPAVAPEEPAPAPDKPET